MSKKLILTNANEVLNKDVGVLLHDVYEIVFTGEVTRDYNIIFSYIGRGKSQIRCIRFWFSCVDRNYVLNAIHMVMNIPKQLDVLDLSLYTATQYYNLFDTLLGMLRNHNSKRKVLFYIVVNTGIQDRSYHLKEYQFYTRLQLVMFAIRSASTRVGVKSAFKKMPSDLCRMLASFINTPTCNPFYLN